MVRAKVAGIPLISLAGLASLVSSAVLFYWGLIPFLGGTFEPMGLLLQLGLLVTALVIYYVSVVYHRGKGVRMDLAFKEIPPD
jgi:hypothetical protein